MRVSLAVAPGNITTTPDGERNRAAWKVFHVSQSQTRSMNSSIRLRCAERRYYGMAVADAYNL
jgi:hypothetical protein